MDFFVDGDFVVAHTGYDFFGPKIGIDIFRFEDGKIVEHWDNLQAVSEKTASGRCPVYQHNPAVADGLPTLGAAIKAMADAGTPMTYTANHAVLGEGNFVLTVKAWGSLF